jgi:hypothetical protein
LNLNPEDPIVRTVILGRQVTEFLSSDVGAYLMQRADDFAQEAIDALTRVDPEDPKAIRVLQNKIAVADLIASWLREAEAQGEQAEQHLKELQ